MACVRHWSLEYLGDIWGCRYQDYVIPRYDFSMKFVMTIPGKEVWRNCAGHLVKDSIQIFTDGFKLVVTVGIYSKSVEIAESIRLLHYYSVFQAEVLAI